MENANTDRFMGVGYAGRVLEQPVRYTSSDEDSARWEGFSFRPGDIVISTRSNGGTTWMQMICALLIFQTPELPAPLGKLSPWLDWLITPRQQVVLARLEARTHRRFIKTHMPLDGIPLDPRAAYIVVGRHPLDLAVSLYHQSNNINRDRVRKLTASTGPEPRRPQPGLHHWLANLNGEMRRLAGLLGIGVPEELWPSLVRAATFDEMRARAAAQAADPAGVLKDRAAFFRGGYSGAGREVLNSAELSRYYARTARLAPPDLLDRLHRESIASLDRVEPAEAG